MGTLHSIRDGFVSGWIDWTASHIGLFLMGIILAAWIAREIHIWAFHLRGVPGPFWNSISCNWTLFRKGYSATLYQWETQLSQKHGTVRLYAMAEGEEPTETVLYRPSGSGGP
jgi:hypothetical protein